MSKTIFIRLIGTFIKYYLLNQFFSDYNIENILLFKRINDVSRLSSPGGHNSMESCHLEKVSIWHLVGAININSLTYITIILILFKVGAVISYRAHNT